MSKAKARPRVCMTTQEYPPMFWGGLAQAVQRVAGFVSEMGWEVHVLNLYEEQGPPGLLDEIVEMTVEDRLVVHRIRIGRERPPAWMTLWDSNESPSIRLMYQSLERAHLKYDFDLFHAFFIYPIGYVAALLARLYQKKLIVSIRGNDINQHIFSPEKVVFLQTALKQADCVTAVAGDLLVKAETLTPVMNKSRVIFNSVSLGNGSVGSVELARLDGSVVGAVGLFKQSKGLPYLLKAFHEIRRDRKSSLLVVGDFREAEREIQNRYLSHFGSKDVHLTGPVPHRSIESYMNRMDVFVLPSLSEGCPNTLLEAMAAGRPIVATKTGAIPEIIRDGENGLLVDPGDSDQIRDAVLYLLDHPEKAEAMGRKARIDAEAYSEERERQKWRALYQII
ncbi:MAG: glycosyltransferase [Proteobacteria bacterium]|nr:glycosyltransferase [Pseudomonadota bacterium]NIS72118.1 glycosyltransferase [Pseudomonadota bacterium]